MNAVEIDPFLTILGEVCQKTFHNAMIQNARMNELWNRHMNAFNAQKHPIQHHAFDMNAFASSIPFRIETLERCEKILVDTYWAIKMVAIALFDTVPRALPSVSPHFQDAGDVDAFTLKIAEKFVNALLVFFTTEKDIVTPVQLVYGKINAMLRVKRYMTRDEILATMARDGTGLPAGEIDGAMETLASMGVVAVDPADPGRYVHVKKIELRPEQEAFVQKECFPLVDWAIETWRTMFNIRELNTPIPESYTDKALLEHVVSHAATQGFTNAHFCFVELRRHFEARPSRC